MVLAMLARGSEHLRWVAMNYRMSGIMILTPTPDTSGFASMTQVVEFMLSRSILAVRTFQATHFTGLLYRLSSSISQFHCSQSLSEPKNPLSDRMIKNQTSQRRPVKATGH